MRGRSSGFRIVLPAAPSRPPPVGGQWLTAAFVPGHSGGSATDSHRLPSCRPLRPPHGSGGCHHGGGKSTTGRGGLVQGVARRGDPPGLRPATRGGRPKGLLPWWGRRWWGRTWIHARISTVDLLAGTPRAALVSGPCRGGVPISSTRGRGSERCSALTGEGELGYEELNSCLDLCLRGALRRDEQATSNPWRRGKATQNKIQMRVNPAGAVTEA